MFDFPTIDRNKNLHFQIWNKYSFTSEPADDEMNFEKKVYGVKIGSNSRQSGISWHFCKASVTDDYAIISTCSDVFGITSWTHISGTSST
jgi:hypothetical protein